MTEVDEMPMSGGRMTAGVVRVGDTVRRPPRANSAFVRKLLNHLSARGFQGAPRALGTDERGRDMLSYLDGTVPADLAHYDDTVLAHAGALIRTFHDLGADLAEGNEIVCHNDLSPCNFVFVGGMPVAIIDFDAAAPGTRAHDLGYAVWMWLDIGSPAVSPSEQRRRIYMLLAAYGMPHAGVDPVLQAMVRRQRMLIEAGQATGNVAMAEWAEHCLAWTQSHLV